MISRDLLQAVPSRYVISLELVFGRMDPVVFEEVVGIEEMKQGAADDIDNCWKNN